MKTAKQTLLDHLRYCKGAGRHYIALEIETRGNEENEIIINPTANFEQKAQYIDQAYTDDLVLKSFDGIRIVHFTEGDTFKEIEDKLC